MLKHFSLFSGIGGIDLAAEWAGFTTVGQCEWADYPTKVLEKHWPDVPRWRDIRDVTAESVRERIGGGKIFLLSGGFPCQPFSVAGKQKGKEDNRYLWPEMLRVIRELTPSWVIGENVPGILRIAADDVCQDLEREGYEVGIFNFEAAAIGARHRRERIFFVGHSKYDGQPTIEKLRSDEKASNKRGTEEQKKAWEFEGTSRSTNEHGIHRSQSREQQSAPRTMAGRDREKDADVANTKGEQSASSIIRENSNEEQRQFRGSGCSRNVFSNKQITRCSNVSATANTESWKSRENLQRIQQRQGCGFGSHDGEVRFVNDWWEIEPNVGRVANGVPSRVDRLKCLGNAVVPQQVYPILKAIYEIEMGYIH